MYLISSTQRRVVSFPPEKREVLIYLFKSEPGQRVVKELVKAYFVFIDEGK